MTRNRLVFAVIASALAAAPGAFADENRRSFRLAEDSVLQGVELKAGSYKVAWRGEGADVEVTLHQGKHEVVRSRATLGTASFRSPNDTATLEKASDGALTLVELRFAGKDLSLRFPAASAQKRQAPRPERVARAERPRTAREEAGR